MADTDTRAQLVDVLQRVEGWVLTASQHEDLGVILEELAHGVDGDTRLLRKALGDLQSLESGVTAATALRDRQAGGGRGWQAGGDGTPIGEPIKERINTLLGRINGTVVPPPRTPAEEPPPAGSAPTVTPDAKRKRRWWPW